MELNDCAHTCAVWETLTGNLSLRNQGGGGGGRREEGGEEGGGEEGGGGGIQTSSSTRGIQIRLVVFNPSRGIEISFVVLKSVSWYLNP